MNFIERELHDFCKSVYDLKVTERKKKTEILRERLDDEEVLGLLNRNSAPGVNALVSWSDIFLACHKCLKVEAERVAADLRKEKKSSTIGRDNLFYMSLVSIVASKANSGNIPLLPCRDIVSCSLEILEKNIYKKFFAEGYINLLSDYALPIPFYWGEISPNNWNDLFEVAIRLCKRPPEGVIVDRIVALLELIIRHGCPHSHLALIVKKRFSLLVDIIKSQEKELSDSYIQLCLTMCRLLVTESRKAICIFGEEIIPLLLNTYPNRCDDTSRKKANLIDILVIFVKAHHPEGAVEGSIDSLACDWALWRRRLLEIYCRIQKELYNYQYSRRSNHQLQENFVVLAVDVMKQVYVSCTEVPGTLDVTVPTMLNESVLLSGPHSKRRRVETTFQSLLDQLLDLSAEQDQTVMWPWLAILSDFISIYPHCLSGTDYINTLKFLSEQMMIDQKVTVILNHCCRCCISLLKVDKYLKINDDNKKDQITKFWSKIYEVTLRLLELNHCNNSFELAEEIVQLNPEFSSRLVQLFNNRLLHVTQHSLKTFVHLCQSSILQEELGSKNCELLLNWLLVDKSNLMLKDWRKYMLPADTLARALIGLVMRNKLPSHDNKNDVMSGNILHSTINSSYCIYTFENSINKLPESDKDENDSSVNWLDTASTYLMELIFRDIRLLMEQDTDDIHEFFIILLYHASLLVEIANLMEIHKSPTLGKICEILCSVLNKLESLFSQLSEQERSHSVDKELVCHLKMFGNYLQNSSTKVVSIVFTHDVRKDFLGYLWQVVDSPRNECVSRFPLDFKKLNERCQTQVDGMKAIASLVFSPCCIKNDYSNLYSLLNALSNKQLKHPNILQIYVVLLEHIILNISFIDDKVPTDIVDNITEKILYTLRDVCKIWCKVAPVAQILIRLFKEMVIHIGKTVDKEHDNVRNFLQLVNAFYKKLPKFGADVNWGFVKMLENFIKVDWAGSWFKLTGNDIMGQVPVSYLLFDFLHNPFHQVRMAAAQFIGLFFSLTPNMSDHKALIEKALKLLNSSVKKSFVVEGELSEVERDDEAVNRTFSALSSLANVLATSPRFHSRIVDTLFSLVYEKEINTDLVLKFLKLIGEKLKLNDPLVLIENNISNLLCYWHEHYKNYENFPWALTNCSSEAQFYNKYRKLLVPVICYRSDIKTCEHIANVLQLRKEDLIKECYPCVMAFVLPALVGGTDSTDHNGQNINTIQQIIGDSSVEDLSAHVVDIIIHVFRTLYDPEHLITLCSVPESIVSSFVLPVPEKINIKFSVLSNIIKYLQVKLTNSQSIDLITHLAVRRPDCIEKLLLQLYIDIGTALSPEFQLLSCHRYIAVCELIGNQLSDKKLKELSTFIVCRIIHVLLNLISRFHNVVEMGLLMAAVSYLEHFLSLVLPSCADIIDTLLHHIVTTIVPLKNFLAQPICEKAVMILNLIVVQNFKVLPSIAKLDPLPDDPEFETISNICKSMRYNAYSTYTDLVTQLSCDIKHFLDAGEHHLNHSCRLEGLKYLRKRLSSRKNDLGQLYDQLQTKRVSSSDCSKSLLHQLICMLVCLTSSADKSVAIEAARCLGELGPVDLTTLVLQADRDQFTGTLDELSVHMAVYLSNFLLDSQNQVTQAASTALQFFVNTKSGFHAVENLSDSKQELLFPFTKTCRRLRSDVIVRKEQLNIEEFAASFRAICPEEQMSHKEWVTNLAQTLLLHFPEDTYLRHLIPVCLAKVSFAEEMILYIVHLVLLSSQIVDDCQNSCVVSLIENVCNFLQLHFDSNVTISNSEPDTVSDIYSDRASVRTILNVATCIYQRLFYGNNKRDFQNIPELNYLQVAKAAQFCSAFFTSVFYGELWFYSNYSDNADLSYMERSNSHGLEYITEKNLDAGLTLQNLLYKAYQNIGEPDAVYGCAPTQLSDPDARLQHYQLERKWDRVMETCDLELSKGKNLYLAGLVSAINSAGLNHLANVFVTASNSANDQILSEIQHESAWRLGQWNLPESKESYQGLVYSALRGMSFSDSQAVANAVADARILVISSLNHISFESAHNIYKYLSQLQSLQEIEDFEEMDLQEILKKWEAKDKLGWVSYDFVEPVFAQRIVMTGMHGGEEQVQVCIKCTQSALTESRFPVAARSLQHLTNTQCLSVVTDVKVKLEQAQIFWARGDTYIGRHMLRSLLAELKDVENVDLKILYSCALRIYGTWMAETRSENAEQIVKNYLLPAFEMVSQSKDFEIKMAAMSSLARFTDQEYQALSQYTKSADFQNKIEKAHKAEEKVEMMVSSKATLTNDQKKASRIFKNQSVVDGKEISSTKSAQENYLLLSVKYYLKCLIEGDDDDVRIFRIISLWLENKNHEGVYDLLSEHIKSIPTFKFLMVLPQLAAHITDANDEFSIMLLSIFEKCSVEHPHHTLPIILAIAHSYKDMDNKQSKQAKKTMKEGRVSGCEILLSNLKRRTEISNIVNDMIKLSEAYIHLANTPVPAKNVKTREPVKLSKSEPILKLGSLPKVLFTTLTIPYRRSADYSNIVGVHSFDNYYDLVGGLNLPKKIGCVGTDGVKRIQLVKGNDDLRQDAVMIQVFTILNSLLQKNKRTNQRKLVIRTYKVVPMSQRSGVIEWCSNTKELGDYLVGKNGKSGAHQRFRPNDALPVKCRELMASVAGYPKERKLEVFNEVCQMIYPVMHNYFIENYSTPGVWFEKRLAYTRSVACSSMIGYILGLGDRHVTNILIDKATAELIHIDFGIAFEMGKCLPTPETVPFRLTRDIVDGMGISGVEGVFRRCCEETMVVLRSSQKTLMTILEVLLYDPLFTWTVLPQKTVDQQIKSMNTSTASSESTKSTQEVSPDVPVNEWAERALLRLKQKLQGTEQGSTGPTSVEGQIEWLIQESRDPANLCCLFHGWQAYL